MITPTKKSLLFILSALVTVLVLPAWQTSLSNPSFAAYADLCGALGIPVRERDELDGALERAFAHDGPSLVEVFTDSLLV